MGRPRRSGRPLDRPLAGVGPLVVERRGRRALATGPRRLRRAADRARAPRPAPASRPSGSCEAILLGAAYPLGLIRTGEEASTKRRVVQFSALGRYVLAAGPTPPPRPAFEQFLFVQPNFEVIAYRQGLTPQLVGRLSRFAWWSQIGSALELKLSRESIVFGLDRGAKPKWMLEMLTRHSQHPLSRGVVDAINNWAERRERVIFYAATTLIEFGNQADRDRALELWPEDDEARAGAGRRTVPAGRRRSNRPVRSATADELARLSPASGSLRDGRARRRDAGARPGPRRPPGGCRARPLRRPLARARNGPRPRAASQWDDASRSAAHRFKEESAAEWTLLT